MPGPLKPNSKPTPHQLEQVKLQALANLAARKALNLARIDNTRLPAGEPMYFYCVVCGYLSDMLPENYLGVPRTLCTECQFMKEQGWLIG